MENQAQQTQQPQFTPEQLNTIKNTLITTFLQKYIAFMQELRNFPGHPGMKMDAYKHFDNGMLWIKESIVAMDANAIVPVQQPTSEPDASPEAQPEAPSEPQAQTDSAPKAE